MRRILITVALAAFSLNANALSILLNGGNSERDVIDRLTGLGHTVEESNAVWWGSDWDFSSYDIVAFQYGASNPTDIGNLVSAVEAGEVGVVFFRGWGAGETAEAFGMSDGTFNWQYAYDNFEVTDNSHYITQGIDLGTHDLGYTYMSSIPVIGPDATALANGADAAALVVHNDLRVAITPFYGHISDYENETDLGIQITERTLQWAAGATVVPIPAAVWLFGSALMGLGWIRRKQAV